MVEGTPAATLSGVTVPKDISSTAFLDVEASLLGRRWVGPSPDELRLAEAIAQTTGLSEPTARVLAARDIMPEDAERYLAPRLRDLMPDPRGVKDLETAARRLVTAVRNNERVAIFADYDVDGGASAALLLDWLRQLGRDATLYVPDRIHEGYGPNPTAMEKLAAAHDLIVCVDCGTLSFDAIAAADAADVVIIDHHLADIEMPRAMAVVNPNRQDETGELAHLCAAAVVFLVLVDANRQQRDAGDPTPDLMRMLDLVALATVADVAPLIGLNRALVTQGLKVMAARSPPRPGGARRCRGSRYAAHRLSPGLRSWPPRQRRRSRRARGPWRALPFGHRPRRSPRLGRPLARVEPRAPRDRNRSPRRRDGPGRGARARRSPCLGRWRRLAPRRCGHRRRPPERSNRPSRVVIGLENGEGKGSARSVRGVDLGSAVQTIAAEGLLIKGGGHKMAAGLTVDQSKIEPAMERLGELLARQGAGQTKARDMRIDAALMPGAATVELVTQIEAAGPFGQSAPAPRFAFPDVQILHARQVGSGHLKLRFGDGMGRHIDAFAFDGWTSPLGEALSKARGARAHLAGRLSISHWGGRQTVELRLEDAALPH